VAFKDEKIPLTATAGRELYQPDRAANTQVPAHYILQTAAIYGQRAAANTAAIIKTQAAQTAQLGLILAAARAADDDSVVVAQGDRVIAAIEAVDVTSEVNEIKALLAETDGSAEMAPVIAALDALPARILGKVAAAQQGAADR
jgi:hypothetical protein